MTGQVIDARAHSQASPAEVFSVVSDTSSWTEWGIWYARELEQPGADSPEGVGAVRTLTSRRFGRTIVSRERVTEVEPGRMVAYVLVSGLPLRGYRSRIELVPDGEGDARTNANANANGNGNGNGTMIHWQSRFERATPGLTWLYVRIFRSFLQDTVERLARYADEHRQDEGARA
jgi:Polyketide cyclase / dehydrase and lipid transport